MVTTSSQTELESTEATHENENKDQSVLLVDDDTVLAGLWQIYLQRLGFRVDCCGTVGDAEILLQSNQYRLLIVDLFLREEGRILEEGGVTLINRVSLGRSAGPGSKKRMAVLAVTGAPARSAGKFSASDSIQNLADGILHKPVRLEELGREIHRLIAATA